MRILFIHTFYKLPGGEDIVVKSEIDLLRENGHEVSLLRFDNNGFSLVKLLALPFNPTSYLKIKSEIKRFCPDIVHIHNIHFAASPSIIYAVKGENIPLVMTLHNYRFLCPSGSLFYDKKIFLDSLKPGFPWLAVKNGVYKNSMIVTFWLAMSNSIHRKLRIFDKVDKFIVLGEHSYKLFSESHLKNYAERIVVKRNFSPERERSELPLNSYFLFIGRLTEEKGIKTLLEAVSGTGIKLKIVGSGPLENLVISTCANNTNIEFLNQQPPSNIQNLLDSAEALIFPSEWFETFGMVLIEAFSKSLPVIASDLGNISNIVKNNVNGLTFKPGNFDDLRSKLQNYNNFSTEIKLAFREGAKQTYLQNFTPSINYAKQIEIYADAINKHFCRR